MVLETVMNLGLHFSDSPPPNNRFFFQGAKLWNNLPIDIKEMETLDKFKFALKAHFIDQYSQNI